MDTQLWIICGLTFVIHVIATLAYAVRIAGVRTRRIAVSFSLFGIIALVSRTANSFQGPFIAKRVELDISRHLGEGLLADFRLFLLSATVASVVGALLIPTFQRYFSRAVHHFQANRSVSRLLLRVFSRDGVGYIRGGARLPSPRNVTQLATGTGVSWQVIVLNVVAMAIWTVGVFASLYAGYLKPELRVTCANLSSIINGFATVAMAVIIDPQVSVMTDDVSRAAFAKITSAARSRRWRAHGCSAPCARKPRSFPQRSSLSASPSSSSARVDRPRPPGAGVRCNRRAAARAFAPLRLHANGGPVRAQARQCGR
ncbi:hypothetical protein X888_4007 [Burkholderia pseudomallei MSHR4377]|nr:hypothetical protein X888_4007 [Burkholderia pseudomallei MSHR4377]